MIALLIPSSETIEEALEFAHAHGEVIRVVLLRGEDGRIRGNALVRPR